MKYEVIVKIWDPSGIVVTHSAGFFCNTSEDAVRYGRKLSQLHDAGMGDYKGKCCTFSYQEKGE